MKSSEVRARLLELEMQHGDMDVLVDCLQLMPVDEIDVDTVDTGIIIWPVYEAEETDGTGE